MEYGKNKKKALQMSTFPLVVSPYKVVFYAGWAEILTSVIHFACFTIGSWVFTENIVLTEAS